MQIHLWSAYIYFWSAYVLCYLNNENCCLNNTTKYSLLFSFGVAFFFMSIFFGNWSISCLMSLRLDNH